MWRTHSCVPRAHSWARRAVGLLFAILLAAIPVRDAIAPVFQVSDLEKAPVLLTGEVVVVNRAGPAEESQTWRYETWRMTADVRVLRSFTKSVHPMDRVQVSFLEYAPGQAMTSPPMLPSIEAGQTLIFPLRANNDPAQPYELLDTQGVNLTLPAHAVLTDSETPTTAHAFILRELANAIAHGNRQEILAMARYLRGPSSSVAQELVPLIESQAGDDRERWVEIATGLIAGAGIPRPTFAELRSKDGEIPEWASIARAALFKLGDSPEIDALLIRKLVSDAPINAWGSAMSLLEFADRPVLIETLRQALRDDVSGSCYIAWSLARNGHTAFLADALARARRVLSQPVRSADDQPAADLLREFGQSPAATSTVPTAGW